MYWLKNILGIADLQHSISDLEYKTDALRTQVRDALEEISSYKTKELALGRIIAKLDPNYGRHPTDDRRLIAESDAIGEEVIKRLRAEQRAIDNQKGR
jgi:hypothetical protein